MNAAASIGWRSLICLIVFKCDRFRGVRRHSSAAVAVAQATRPGETVTAATIAELPARLASNPSPGPLLVLIGRVLSKKMDGSVLDGGMAHGLKQTRDLAG
jgi:siroheme synthase